MEHPVILQSECLTNQLLDLVHLEAGSISVSSIKFIVYNPLLHIVQKKENLAIYNQKFTSLYFYCLEMPIYLYGIHNGLRLVICCSA